MGKRLGRPSKEAFEQKARPTRLTGYAISACRQAELELDEFHTRRTNATVHKAGVAMPANASQFKCIG